MQHVRDFRLTAPPGPRAKARLEEQEIAISVADYLRVALPRHWFFIHVPNEGIRSKAAAGIQKRMGLLAGAPDLFVFGEGKAYAIEIKAPNGVVSLAQLDFQGMCSLAGVPYAICRSAPQVEASLRSWGVPLKGRCR